MMDIFLRGIIVVYNNIIYCEFNVTKSDWKLQYFLMWNVKKKRWWSAELIFRINEFIRYLFDLINIYYNLNDIYPMEYDWNMRGIWGEINSRIWIVYFFCLCYIIKCIRVELLIFKFILRFMTKWLHVSLSFL